MRHEEALSELRELLADIRQQGETTSYGHFHGGDPRAFCPDPECSTEEERTAHQEACARWEAGNREPLPGPHVPLDHAGVGWMTLSGFGLGTNVLIDEQAQDWAERLGRCIERLEREDG